MILVILASGRGSRLKHKTKNNPKCMTKVGDKFIIDYLIENFKNFKKVIIVTGYKSQKIINHLRVEKKIKNLIFVKNKNFLNTNMVESFFKTKKFINQDLVVTYSDIIFDKKIMQKLILKKETCLPLNSNWYNIWKLRTKNLIEIKNDAEDVSTSGDKIISIGSKINKKLPKLQFMGLIKIVKKDYFQMLHLYAQLNNKQIDMTSFLNEYIKKKTISFFKTSKYWFEIDNIKDSKIATKNLKI